MLNAFKEDLPPVPKAPVATRSNLIHIYESPIKADLEGTLQALRRAGAHYQRIIANTDDDHVHTVFDAALLGLARVQGAPSYILLLRLMGRQERPLTAHPKRECGEAGASVAGYVSRSP